VAVPAETDRVPVPHRMRAHALVGGLALATVVGAGPLVAQAGPPVPLAERLARVDFVEAATLILLARDDGGDDGRAASELARAARGEVGGSGSELDLSLLGERTAEIIARSRAFRRDVVAALQTAHPRRTVEILVEEYLGRPELSFPAAPKDMQVLYDHESALAFRTRHPELNGVLWSGRWFSLAVTEPLTDVPSGAERQAGLDTVTARYFAKLSGTEPPQAPPSELPLAPAIAPGLVWVSPEAAMIWDNHAFFVEVVADILSDPEVEEPAAAIESAAEFFTDRATAVTPQLMWETMALRHGIFFQGGYPIALMTENERNMNSHGAHMQRGGPVVMPGMGRR